VRKLQSEKTVKKYISAYEKGRETHTLTFSLPQVHKRPERRKRQESAGWKRRELVFLKIKRPERRSERESQASLSSASHHEDVCRCVRVRVCV